MDRTERIAVPPIALELHWKDGLIDELLLDWSSKPARPETPTSEALQLISALELYVQGEQVDWPELPLSWDKLSDFSRCVLSTLKNDVGWGDWVSYSELARRCNSPKAARAVGAVMRSNPWPLVVPCHRVLGKKGNLTGFGGGLPMKKLFLDLEKTFPSCTD